MLLVSESVQTPLTAETLALELYFASYVGADAPCISNAPSSQDEDLEGNALPTQVLRGNLQGRFLVHKQYYWLHTPLPLCLEIYDHAQVLARSALYPAVSGYGASPEEALEALELDLVDSVYLYNNTPDDQLTADALELKARLQCYVQTTLC